MYSDAEALGSFLRRDRAARKLKRTRATAKMYAVDTSLPSGPDWYLRDAALKKELIQSCAMSKVADKLEARRKLKTTDLECVGALIIFNSAVVRDRCFQEHQKWNSVYSKLFRNLPDKFYYKGAILEVDEAPHPDDVLWENSSM